MKIIETERLILRTWLPEDIDEYYRINQDSQVRRYIPLPMSKNDARNFISRMNEQFTKTQYTLWAVEEKFSGKLIGFIGLNSPSWQAHFTPCVEIGWQLASEYWDKGYATEGAKAALKYGFEVIGLKEIVAFTVPANQRSLRVMEKLGMQRDVKGDFFHPMLSQDNEFSRHVLYRITGSRGNPTAGRRPRRGQALG